MNKKQLTAADRAAIEALLNNNISQNKIAQQLGFHKSTVSREINKRTTPNGYKSKFAEINYRARRKSCQPRKKLIQHSTFNYVLNHLIEGYSPATISGRMKLEKRNDYVGYETIYKFIYADEYCKREKVYQYLPLAKKKRKSWKGRTTHKSKIPNRVSIHKRNPRVEKRIEYGHWEGDSVIYPHKKAINTMNELLTGKVKFTLLERKTAELTKQAILKNIQTDKVKTLTLDNGLEFTYHEDITKQTKTEIYFADPYSSYQRGANENVNRLLRKYLPKKHNINHLTQKELNEIEDFLNNLPRKRLNYYSPNEYFEKFMLESK